MANLNIFIDGSWLFKACAAGTALSNTLEYQDSVFHIDFARLSDALLTYARGAAPDGKESLTFGERFFCTSIFSLPDDLDQWLDEHEGVTNNDIDTVRRSVSVRTRFSDSAIQAGYSDAGIFHPRLRPWMLEKLREHRFQEKQVDATVVAMLVRAAITQPDDYHAILTGDADVLPAIRVAYPEYSNNVFVVTTHPDQLGRDARQTSFKLADFNYKVPPYFLDLHAESFVVGAHAYRCQHCNKVFVRTKPIPKKSLPCCSLCNQRRT